MIHSRRVRRFAGPPAGAAALALVALSAAAQPGTLFPQPFRLEHHLEQVDADQTRFVSEPVVDSYGGSWIVSERRDGSRLVIDLARREVTEIRPAKGTYWTVGFARLAELERRLRRAAGLAPRAPAAEGPAAARAPAAAGSEEAPPLKVIAEPPAATSRRQLPAKGRGAGDLTARAGVHHVRVVAGDEPGAAARGMEVWTDPSLRMSPNALAALAELERAALGAPEKATASATESPAAFLAAARSAAGGAVVVKTSRPLALTAAGEPLGRVDDVATRLETLDRFPAELVEVPEGLRRVPHPLEAAVRFLEEDRERNRRLAGEPADGPGAQR